MDAFIFAGEPYQSVLKRGFRRFRQSPAQRTTPVVRSHFLAGTEARIFQGQERRWVLRSPVPRTLGEGANLGVRMHKRRLVATNMSHSTTQNNDDKELQDTVRKWNHEKLLYSI